MTYPRILAHALLLLAIAGAAVALAALRPPEVHVDIDQAPPQAPDTGGEPRGFTVVGTATLEAVPDLAELHATVAVERNDARSAGQDVLLRQKAATAALDEADVATTSVSLSQMSLDPVHDPKTGRLRAYQAAISLTVTTAEFDRLPAIVDALARAGATSISTTFKVSDLPALKKKVRQMAGTAAVEKARELASAVGFKLGAVRAVVESPGDAWSWNGSYANMIVTESAPVAPHGDLQKITLSVSVTYALDA